MCNMILVLLVVSYSILYTVYIFFKRYKIYILNVKASLEFDLPLDFVIETLIFTHLNRIKYVKRTGIKNEN